MIPSVDINMTVQADNCENTITYWVSKQEFSCIIQLLIDSGANGGLAGYEDMLLILPNGEFVNVEGIDNHILNWIELGTFASKVKTNRGICIFLWHNYPRVLTQRRSIHSKFQLEAYGNIVCDGFLDKHQIITPCGHVVPLVWKSGLYYGNGKTNN